VTLLLASKVSTKTGQAHRTQLVRPVFRAPRFSGADHRLRSNAPSLAALVTSLGTGEFMYALVPRLSGSRQGQVEIGGRIGVSTEVSRHARDKRRSSRSLAWTSQRYALRMSFHHASPIALVDLRLRRLRFARVELRSRSPYNPCVR
jgi:hypothetical protein